MQKNCLQTFLSLLMVCCGVTGFSQTYCVTSPSLGNSTDIITKVSLANALGNTYNNSTTYSTASPAYYTSYANTPFVMQTGGGNSISITFGSDGTQYSAVWIDFNRDGIFQASENVGLATTATAGGGTKTYTFSIPATATLGTTTMRVRGGSDNAYIAAGACTASDYGETEDYKINITAATCQPPSAVASANVTDSSGTVTFTAPGNAPGNGYDYFITTTNVAPAAGTAISGHVNASPINLRGNFGNSPVYVWVRSSCSATSNSAIAATPAYLDPFCAITGSTSTATYLNNFQTSGGLTNISSSGTGYAAGGYFNGTAKAVTQNNGGAVSFSTSIVGGTVGVGIWVDWNDNDVFNTNERVYSSGTNYVSMALGSFTVPTSALPGKHRMRIVVDYNSTTASPCALALGRGEVEDYTFIVPPKPPTVAGAAAICPGATTAITASGCAGTIKWSNGATGAVANVPAGSYTATCTIDEAVSPASAAVVVTNVPLTTPTLSGGQAVCQGATATLTAGNCAGTTTWSNGETGASIAAPAGSYTATCTISGCVSAASAAAVVTETVVAPPTVTAGVTNCPAGTATVTASNYSGDIIWSTGETSASITAPAGSYTASTSLNGCLSAKSAPAVVEPCPACPASGNLLVNGSFEDALLPFEYNLAGLTQPGWMEISNVNNGLIKTIKDRFVEMQPITGHQFIELNYLGLGAIAQDIDVAANQPMTLSFFHKARGASATESVRVKVIDMVSNEVIDTMTSTVNNIWQRFTTSFTPTSSKIEVRFISLNASNNGTNLTIGNFLDDIILNYNACPVCISTPLVITGDTTACLGWWSTLGTQGCDGGVVSWNLSSSYSTYQYPSRATVNGYIYFTYVASCTMPGCPDIRVSAPVTITQRDCSTQQRGANNAMASQSALLTVSPNPVVDVAVARLAGFNDGAVSIQITNMNGTVLKTMKYEYAEGSNVSLDLSALGAGMYFIKAEQDGKIATVKVVKK